MQILNQVLNFCDGDIVVQNQIKYKLGHDPEYTVVVHKGIMYMYFFAI